MTTKVTVDAHAGWPVHVTRVDTRTGDDIDTRTVQPHTTEDFYVFDGQSLRIAEGERNPG